MNILLSGGTGYLGRNLVEKIYNNNNLIILIRNKSEINNLFLGIENIKFYNYEVEGLEQLNKMQIDIFIHCATNYGRNKDSVSEILNSNVLFPLNVLSQIKNENLFFINFHTCLNKNTNLYSLSKYQFVENVKLSFPLIKFINVVIDQFYGPNDAESKFTSYIINSLMNNIKEIDLTDGLQKRNFLYIDDLTEAIKIVLQNKNYFKNLYNELGICTKNNVSIKEFVFLVKDLVKNNNTILNFGKINYRKYELIETKINSDLIRSLGWKESFDLKKGILLTINK